MKATCILDAQLFFQSTKNESLVCEVGSKESECFTFSQACDFFNSNKQQ